MSEQDAPFNYEIERSKPKNLLVLNSENDLYTSEETEDYFKKYNLKNFELAIDRVNIKQYLEKLKSSKATPGTSKDLTTTEISSRRDSNSSNDSSFSKNSKRNRVIIESDDEDELPSIDFNLGKPKYNFNNDKYSRKSKRIDPRIFFST